MHNVFPESLSQCLGEFPALLKGKVAEAAEIFLAAKCDYDGALACEAAAHLLDEEMISEDTQYSFEERWNLLSLAHRLDDWAVEADKELLADPVIREKILFIVSLASSYAQRERDNFVRLMNEAAHSAKHLAKIIREKLEAEEAREAENVA